MVQHTNQLNKLLPTWHTKPNTWRPADTVETAIAWKSALERKDGPTALIFSRQNLPFQTRTEEQIQNAAKRWLCLCSRER